METDKKEHKKKVNAKYSSLNETIDNNFESERNNLTQIIEEKREKVDSLNASKLSLASKYKRNSKTFEKIDSVLREEMRNKARIEAKMKQKAKQKPKKKIVDDNSVDITKLNSTLRLKETLEEPEETIEEPEEEVKTLCKSLFYDTREFETFEEYGIYLVDHIEKEQVFKKYFSENEDNLVDQLSAHIAAHQGDSSIIQFLLELWDKLDISYEMRVKLIEEMCDSAQPSVLLNKEADGLSSYYSMTRNIVDSVKNRENYKLKLQNKQETQEVSEKDKETLTTFSKQCMAKLEEFKKRYDQSFVWRGVEYEKVRV